MPSPSIVWFRDDLRLTDNPALRAALDRDEPIVALYILDEESDGVRLIGGAARWWLHGSLASLAARLDERGSTLVLRRGRASEVVPAVVEELDAGAVFWNRRYGGVEREIDAGLKEKLRNDGVTVASFAANLLYEPWTVRTQTGNPYGVYSPFARAVQKLPAPRPPLPEARKIPGFDGRVDGDDLGAWDLLPTKPDWAGGLRETWEPGEPAAKARLKEFLDDDLGDYSTYRDEFAGGATSNLSPRLRWGELSPYQVWHDTLEHKGSGEHAKSAGGFLSELVWREFAWHVTYHSPDIATANWRRNFDAFPWPELNRAHLETWQQGKTGVAVVDAGMRQLWHTGVMHNRVRMVTASFLIKNLLIDWRHGEQWFWDCLVDADAASNPFNWQWVAGSGADAAPYFRVFNPETQRKKFDSHDRYVREWAPEYLDENPPEPMVDLGETRKRALDAYAQVRHGG
ncbi:cryptochrome/photolyase family protein [Microbacterium proteolyticum]|jgi:deoxyribodipyrimidine photo-lyase|uniref:cryptochrome/photolyase family protein n=1 Tax=Microbacterium proteolyticum TaxID=1572644 RepID=UPI001FACEA1B|nr:deoxyribodipyrimidine photo-lyase [Microbacterium proteolyticum]MCI9858565.1 deoxyribodipyrimidine photo-lyase [Microbacterium proteolyticum]